MIGPLTFVLFYCTMKRRDNGSVYSFRYILVLGISLIHKDAHVLKMI